MRKLVFVLLLPGCAAQPQGPTEQQLAIIQYLSQQCAREGVNPNDERAMKGCILIKAEAASAAYNAGVGNVLGAMGQTLIQGTAPRPQQCFTRPDYLGGFVTTCP